MNIKNVKPAFDRLSRLLPRRHKIYLLFLIALTIGFSLVETLGVSVIMPFISVASNPGLLDSGWYKKAFDFFGFADAQSFIITIGAGIIGFYLFRAVYSVVLTWLINRFSRAMHKYLTGRLFEICLSIPYKIYAQKNSGELGSVIFGETGNVSNLVLYILMFCIELFTILLVYVLMLVMNWKMTLVVTVILSVMVWGLLHLLIMISKAQGARRTSANLKMGRTVREAFGNFKFIRLKGSEKRILETYGESINIAAKADIISGTLGAVPKSILESFGFSLLVAAVIFILIVYKDASKVIPTISMYALALYRILPAVHRLLGNVNSMAFIQKSLELVDEFTRQPTEKEGAAPVSFARGIRLDHVSFEYIPDRAVLKDVSLEIRKGEKIAFTGESGGGKSTLADLIIGIHKPVSGALYIDDSLITNENVRSWRRKIGYIPQSIYLFDGTVAENVTLGSVFDEAKIKQILQMANIWDFLETKEGIHTFVGEGGIQLSGGQQQRIGIARALYDDPDVLVLDEATSALDTETEIKIMDEIYNVSKNKTLIVIAHRLSTVERCDRKIIIENGRIV